MYIVAYSIEEAQPDATYLVGNNFKIHFTDVASGFVSYRELKEWAG
jgi:citrate lyase alpha subunit